MEFLSSSPAATKQIAAFLGREIGKTQRATNAFIVGLDGNLGAGKTTFIQGFARGLGIKRKTTSPTFLIIRNYGKLYHVDAYRLKHSRELSALGFKEILKNPENIVIVEWADKVKKLLPRKMIWIKMRHGKRENERIIRIETKKR